MGKRLSGVDLKFKQHKCKIGVVLWLSCGFDNRTKMGHCQVGGVSYMRPEFIFLQPHPEPCYTVLQFYSYTVIQLYSYTAIQLYLHRFALYLLKNKAGTNYTLITLKMFPGPAQHSCQLWK